MKVLITYALTGLGHLREATSVKNALDKAGIENTMFDFLNWAKRYNLYTKITILPLRFGKWLHEATTKNSSILNNFQIPRFLSKLAVYILRLMEFPVGLAFRRYLHNKRFDAYIAMHPWGMGALWALGVGKKLKQTLITVIPDEIDASSASFYAIPDKVKGPMHFVNSKKVSKLMIEVGVAPSKIKIVGHVLDPMVLDKRKQIYKRVQEDIGHSVTLTLGLFVGGAGTFAEIKRIKQIFTQLQKYIKGGLYKIKVIPGPHFDMAMELHQLFSDLELTATENIELFVNTNRSKVIAKGHEWFVKDLDVMFAKTGELIFYSLATGIPFIHFPPKGAQEVQHIVLMKQLVAIENFDEIVNLHEFLQNRAYLKELSDNAYHSKYGLAGAEKIANYIKTVPVTTPLYMSHKHKPSKS